MKAVLALGLAIICTLSLADGLKCNVCDVKVPLLGCVSGKNTVDCKSGDQCLKTKGYAGTLHVVSKLACVTPTADNCNGTEKTDEVFSLKYTNTCCNVDLCNAGSVGRLSYLAGLAALGLCLMKLF